MEHAHGPENNNLPSPGPHRAGKGWAKAGPTSSSWTSLCTCNRKGCARSSWRAWPGWRARARPLPWPTGCAAGLWKGWSPARAPWSCPRLTIAWACSWGSRGRHRRVLNEHPGSYFMDPFWLDTELNIFDQIEKDLVRIPPERAQGPAQAGAQTL